MASCGGTDPGGVSGHCMNRSSESREGPYTVRYGETRGLRVCLVAGQFPPTIGGEERHAKLLSSALVRCGHEVCVLTQSIVGEPSEETLEGVRVVRAIRFLRQRRLVGLSYAASVALFLLRTRKHFNIVQTTYLYWETVIAALLKPVLNGRLVVRIVISGAAGDIACFQALRLWPLPESWRQRAVPNPSRLWWYGGRMFLLPSRPGVARS